MKLSENKLNVTSPRVIETARTKKSINQAAKKGYKPLLRKVIPSPEIKVKYSVLQHKITGGIEVIGDYRDGFSEKPDEYETVIDWTYYYPYSFKSPYAAYLIPPDIQKGEKVFIQDLIEDIIGMSWNQGDTYRLESCEAIWNGMDLELLFDPSKDNNEIIG
jgi:hypothetical protein